MKYLISVVFAIFLPCSFCLADGRDDFTAAEKLFMENRHLPAIQLYMKALESGLLSKEETLQGSFNVAAGFMMLGRNDDAIISINKVLALDPNNADAYSMRADMWDIMGKDDLALKDWDRLFELNPKDAIGYNNRSVFYSSRGQLEKAIDDMEKYIALEPGSQDGKKALTIMKDRLSAQKVNH